MATAPMEPTKNYPWYIVKIWDKIRGWTPGASTTPFTSNLMALQTQFAFYTNMKSSSPGRA